MLPGAIPTDLEYASMQDVLRRDKGRTIHFHWSGAYDLSGEVIEIDNIKSEYYQKVLLETDYISLGKVQRNFEAAMRNHWITITNPRGTNIKFKIGNRPVNKQDGNASSKREPQLNLIDREIELPSGAIRVAPIEDTVEGSIAFPNSILNGNKVEEIKKLFATSFEVEPRWLIESASRRQKWIDQSQSLNLYISDPNGKKLDVMYRMAWLKGLKTTYYLRSRSATTSEKSTITNLELNAVQSAAQAPEAPSACSILDPDCDACQ
mgnify:CR=1 FL=1